MTAFRILRWGSDELPPAVCLHDVRGHARRFERVARMLERGRLVVAYDLRGHGRSPWSGPHTIEQHADDLHEVLDACGIDQAGLIGDGFGARVAIAYAVRNQERINSLTLLEPPLAPSPEAMREAARVERDGGGYAGVDEAIDRRRQEDGLLHTPRGLLEEEMAEHLVADDDGRYRYRYSREAAAAALEAAAHPETRLVRRALPDHADPRPRVAMADRRRRRGSPRRGPQVARRGGARRPRGAVGCDGRDQRACAGLSGGQGPHRVSCPSMKTLVLQHIACEPPGVFEDVLIERGAAITRVELDEGGQLPDWRDFDLIVAMGGPMSVNDESEHPWLVAEKRLIREAVQAGVGYWGACLGVQLLASSLGARVYAGPQPEVGVLGVTLTDEGASDPVFAGLPRELATLQWHGDTFDLPEGAVLLAESPAYPHQAFRYGRAAYGVQFHVEVTGDMAREWATVPAYVRSLEQTLGAGAAPGLFDEFDRAAAGMQQAARQMFERWLDVAVATPR